VNPQVTKVVGRQGAEPLDEPFDPVGWSRHHRAAAPSAAGADQVLPAQHLEGLAQGHGRHTEVFRQPGLGRQTLAVEDQAQPDRLTQPVRHDVGAATGAGRRRQDGA